MMILPKKNAKKIKREIKVAELVNVCENQIEKLLKKEKVKSPK